MYWSNFWGSPASASRGSWPGRSRTIAQAQALESAGVRFDHVISIETADNVVEERLEGRRVCQNCGATYHLTNNPPQSEGTCDNCGHALIQRPDDSAATVRHRLEVYHSETEPLKALYQERNVLSLVEDAGDIESVNRRIMAVLGK